MRRTGWGRLPFAVLGAFVAVTGCSGAPSDVGPQTYVDVAPPLTPAIATDPGCPRDGAGLGAGDMRLGWGPTAGAVPEAFTAVQVRHCVVITDPGQLTAPGSLVRVEERTSPATVEFLATLSLPDQGFAADSALACPANHAPPSYVLLLDADGRAVRVRPPQEPCGATRAEVAAALALLDTDSEKETYTFEQGAP